MFEPVCESRSESKALDAKSETKLAILDCSISAEAFMSEFTIVALAIFAEVIDPSAILISVTASSAIFAVVTDSAASFPVVTLLSAIFAVVTASAAIFISVTA